MNTPSLLSDCLDCRFGHSDIKVNQNTQRRHTFGSQPLRLFSNGRTTISHTHLIADHSIINHIMHLNNSVVNESLYVCIVLPCIFSLLRSFTTINLPTPTHPHRNHLIWLLCPCVIAFCARLHCHTSLRNISLCGALSSQPAPLFFPAEAPLAPPNTNLNIVNGASKMLTYLRRILVELRV